MVQQDTGVVRSILQAFPNLKASELEITSPIDPKYNCIAYAAGDHKRFWWPDAKGTGYWPPKIPRKVSLGAFQKAFEDLNYTVTKTHVFEIGIEKIAIFAKDGLPTHAALQLINGKWSSKLGQQWDISHPLFGIQGGMYGNVVLIMSRSRVRIV